MADSNVIHYNGNMPVRNVMKSIGEGECGKHGTITGYPGVVTCPTCKRICKQENSPANAVALRALCNGGKR